LRYRHLDITSKRILISHAGILFIITMSGHAVALPSPNPFHFESGDVSIKVMYKGTLVTGAVSSLAMSFASPVWTKSICPWAPEDRTEIGTAKKQKTSQSSPVSQIDFRKHDAEALLILLRIAHLQVADIPKHLSGSTLFSLAILCEIYECVNIVKTWLSHWVPEKLEEGRYCEDQRILLIAWTFGREVMFNAVAARLVMQLQCPDQSSFSKHLPDGIVGMCSLRVSKSPIFCWI